MIHNDRVLRKLLVNQNTNRPLLVGNGSQQELDQNIIQNVLSEDFSIQDGPDCENIKLELETVNNAYLATEPEWSEIIFRREIAPCFGDGRYLCSLKDRNGQILVQDRYGILDWKLHEVNKHVNTPRQWIAWSLVALQSVYGYSENGYEVLLTRANLLQDFIDHYRYRYHTMLDTQSILDAAEILSWNIFQADGSSDVKIMDWNHVEPISLSKALSQGGAYA